jgi:adenine-specific DNA methylase
LETDLTFIETQFPVSKLSKESYKERMGNSSQTLTGLGKWWGRKPLILVRAAILGLLLPAGTDPRRDREIFLKLLTMDPEGLWHRKNKAIALADLYERLHPAEREHWFDLGSGKPRFRAGTTAEEKTQLQRLVFERMGYDERLTYCDRPEQIAGPSEAAWAAINAHLDTDARDLPDLVRQLGQRLFGHTPRVGDAFCGGGSVPFEAARIGCEAFGSDLNPVAALLTWGALNIVGGGETVAAQVRTAQEQVYAAVDRQITGWRIEHNDLGWRADAYLYCTETRCPECGWLVPLAPSWVIGEKTHTLARLIPSEGFPSEGRFDIKIHQGVDRQALAQAKSGTVRNSRLECPHCGESSAMGAIRGDRRGDSGAENGLRLWENADLVPRPDDTFLERLYCVRWRLPPLDALLWAEQRERANRPHDRPIPDWVHLDRAITGLAEFLDASDRLDLDDLRDRDWLAEDAELEAAEKALVASLEAKAPKARLDAHRTQLRMLRANQTQRTGDLKALTDRLPGVLYRAAEAADLEREARVLTLLRERFNDWQTQGYIPSRQIVPGDKTTELMRTRGWTHWHHLFTPRQLLIHGLILAESGLAAGADTVAATANLLGAGRCGDWDSRLCRWWTDPGHEKVIQTFSNQALNTLANYAGRSLDTLQDSLFLDVRRSEAVGVSTVTVQDVRTLNTNCAFWITDPPYADAINYHELSEFFLAWYERHLPKLFPDWYPDSKRALAIRGSGKAFREGMVDAYRNLAAHMPNNGMQIVMFTHQDAGVWADLALILWAAGLRVTAAWTVATETPYGGKEGSNYVQGTVLMVLRKQRSQEVAFLDEIVPQVEIEVQDQLQSMLDLDDREDPNFADSDYQLAAYAAALRVLTQYRGIEDIDVAYELARERKRGEESPIVRIIEDAVRTASDFLVPADLDAPLWRRLTPEEKLYLKCLEVESHGDYRSGVFQEFARGLGVREYRFMLESGKANQTRLKTATEFKRRDWGTEGFGSSLMRHCLFAVYQAVDQDSTKIGLTYLKTEIRDYWTHRETLTGLLDFLSRIGIPHWAEDAEAARLLAGAVRNDHV